MGLNALRDAAMSYGFKVVLDINRRRQPKSGPDLLAIAVEMKVAHQVLGSVRSAVPHDVEIAVLRPDPANKAAFFVHWSHIQHNATDLTHKLAMHVYEDVMGLIEL